MSAIAGLISLAMPVSIGYALTGVVGPREAWPGGLWLRLAIAAPIGIGACSMLHFLSLVRGVPPFLFEAALLSLLAVLFYRRQAVAGVRKFIEPIAPAPIERGLRMLFWALVLFDILVFAYRSLKWPRGGWDGWAIWNQRGRFLYLAGGHWRAAFGPALSWSHTDYPLMVPAFLAREWQAWGGETVLVPILLALFFAAALVSLLVLSLNALRGRSQALAAGILLLATPAMVVNAAAQYVDVTLSFFILATIVLQRFADESAGPGRFLALAGVTAGLAAWTKNEGLLLVVAFVLARLVVVGIHTGWRAAVRQTGAFLAGAAPALLVIWYFRRTVVVSSYFLGQSATPSIARTLFDGHRYLKIAGAWLHQLWTFGNPLVGSLVFLAAYLFCAGVVLPRKPAVGFWTAVGVLCLTACGYFMVYVLSPENLDWLLETSLDRLNLQLWPALLWAAGTSARGLDGTGVALFRREPVVAAAH